MNSSGNNVQAFQLATEQLVWAENMGVANKERRQHRAGKKPIMFAVHMISAAKIF